MLYGPIPLAPPGASIGATDWTPPTTGGVSGTDASSGLGLPPGTIMESIPVGEFNSPFIPGFSLSTAPGKGKPFEPVTGGASTSSGIESAKPEADSKVEPASDNTGWWAAGGFALIALYYATRGH